jgi:hypothetical protein
VGAGFRRFLIQEDNVFLDQGFSVGAGDLEIRSGEELVETGSGVLFRYTNGKGEPLLAIFYEKGERRIVNLISCGIDSHSNNRRVTRSSGNQDEGYQDIRPSGAPGATVFPDTPIP